MPDSQNTASTTELWEPIREALWREHWGHRAQITSDKERRRVAANGCHLCASELALDSLRSRMERMEQERDAAVFAASSLGEERDAALTDLGRLRAAAKRMEAVVEAARRWTVLDDEWFAVSDARPFDAEGAARASIAKQDAAKELRRTLDSLDQGEAHA